ncbi:beta-ketoacyl-ACP synthase II [Anaerolineae bacterium CFX9]|nr:beta-ketoacyl-ACP synthase II [Anaerolineae bacterium CFX9]
MSRRVVITGMGMVSPLGLNVEDSWENIKAGKSGVGFITRFDSSQYNVHIAAELKNFDATQYMNAKDVRRRDLYQQYIVAAGKQAFRHSNLEITDENRRRTGVIIGSSVGGINSYYDSLIDLFQTNDPRRISPFAIPMLMVNGGSDYIAMEIGATGPSYTPVSACATGADCIGVAFDLIRFGRLDRALAGAGDAPILSVGVAAFDRTGACSREAEDPTRGVRPFSLNRPGLVFGEGAGVIVMETLEAAQARGAEIYGEIVGYATTSDAYHITAPDPDGTGAGEAVRLALEDARLNPKDIDYINAHGTGTGLNDAMETVAIKRVFGEYAYRVPMSSTKSMTGHAMGATAAIEVIFCLLAMRDGIAPPTINLDEPDPECDLDYVPNTAREMPISVAMSNAFGFGGHNVSLILRKFIG